jgi:hypothetical protein
MNRWVEISFDCLPLRSVGRLDVPLDASPKYRERCLAVKSALEKHGSHNTYYLYNAQCTYRLTNRDDVGMIQFRLEGTVLTDDDDRRTKRCDLAVTLLRETCDWLTEPVVKWLAETVPRSVAVEFDRYVEAGDLDQAKQRIEKLRATCDESGGYLGMYL